MRRLHACQRKGPLEVSRKGRLCQGGRGCVDARQGSEAVYIRAWSGRTRKAWRRLMVVVARLLFQVMAILDLYRRVYEELLAVPVIKGYKTEVRVRD